MACTASCSNTRQAFPSHFALPKHVRRLPVSPGHACPGTFSRHLGQRGGLRLLSAFPHHHLHHQELHCSGRRKAPSSSLPLPYPGELADTPMMLALTSITFMLCFIPVLASSDWFPDLLWFLTHMGFRQQLFLPACWQGEEWEADHLTSPGMLSLSLFCWEERNRH